MPPALKNALDAAATRNGRSLTAEIVHRLESSFATKGGTAAKLKALAEGTFLPEPHTHLDIFRDDGFDPLELNKVLREMAVQIEGLGAKVDAITDSADLAEDAADAAKFAEVAASTPPEQLSTEHLHPKRKK